MAINADILKSKFGFNDPNVIQGILSDPGQSARYEREYAGMTGGGGTTSSTPSTADFVAQQRASQQALMDKYSATVAGQEALPAAYERLTTAAGIPGLQQDIQTYKQQIYQVQDLLDRLNEDVTGRTKGTLTSEAQRRRQIAAEGEPLQANLGRLATGLQPLTEQLATASGNVSTLLGLESQQQTKELLPIQAQISAFSDQAAREVSLYSQDKQSELNQLTLKLQQQGDLAKQEYDRATTLLKQENDYNNQKGLITAQMQANIAQYKATMGKTTTDANKYLGPATSPVGGIGTVTKSGGVNWIYTNNGWLPMQ